MILPDDVLAIVRAYSKPIGTRVDWRTCKREEADLIYSFDYHITDVIPRNLLHHEVLEWSLFGKLWLISAPHHHLYARYRPRLPPPEMEDYLLWYQYRIQWLNG